MTALKFSQHCVNGFPLFLIQSAPNINNI